MQNIGQPDMDPEILVRNIPASGSNSRHSIPVCNGIQYRLGLCLGRRVSLQKLLFEIPRRSPAAAEPPDQQQEPTTKQFLYGSGNPEWVTYLSCMVLVRTACNIFGAVTTSANCQSVCNISCSHILHFHPT